ncbi:MAG: thioredoxin family protein [Cytophagaceae bacterium]|jgi:thiol:disulfide interchange protein DsbD|nr:thioredoxin family protein [Cytophagaceae bacterium]
MYTYFKVFVFLIGFCFSAKAQLTSNPTQWDFSLSSKELHIGDTVEVIIKAKINDTWELYGSTFPANQGPIPTTFILDKAGSNVVVLGGLKSIQPIKKYDDIFDMELTYFKKQAEFRQSIILLKNPATIAFEVQYQVCNNDKCVSFDTPFQFPSLSLLPKTTTTVSAIKKPVLTPTPEDTATVQKVDSMRYDSTSTTSAGLEEQIKPLGPIQKSDGSLWWFVLAAIAAGFVTVITPCVFPMVPMTVTFFTKSSSSKAQVIRKALFYGGSIVFIYTLLGTLISYFNGPEFVHFISTHWIPNTLFTIIFLVFAVSFFGWFEITLPNKWVNAADRQSDKGGYVGIFFMAFTIVLVSFSCTGPIVSTILLSAAGGEVIKPIVGMLAYSSAFALPFTVLAIFPGMLKSLPKSGGWLNTVKVSLGFLELALAFKFLSIADQVEHWGILDREVFLAIWIVIFTFLGLYLLGKIKINDHDKEPIGVFRLIMAIVVFVFVVYLIPGLWGAPLKALSGYLPPLTSQDFVIQSNKEGSTSGGTLCDAPLYGDKLELPLGLKGYFDYEQAKKCAIEQNKPLFIDFTGHGCTNCREMESYVWSDPVVWNSLSTQYVVVALYTDDRTELPKSKWYVSAYDGKEKRTMGKQNIDFQITRFNFNAQPFYVLVDPKTEQPLTEPMGYNRSVEEFVDFLSKGAKNYK